MQIDLPFDVGDKIYDICLSRVDEGVIEGIEIIIHTSDGVFALPDFKGTVFKSHEAAQAALDCKKCIQNGKTEVCHDSKTGLQCPNWYYREAAIKGEIL